MKLTIQKIKNSNINRASVKFLEILSTELINSDEYFIFENEIPVIRFTDTGEQFFISSIQDKTLLLNSEITLDIQLEDLMSSGGEAGAFVPLAGTEVGDPITGKLESILGDNQVYFDFIRSGDVQKHTIFKNLGADKSQSFEMYKEATIYSTLSAEGVGYYNGTDYLIVQHNVISYTVNTDTNATLTQNLAQQASSSINVSLPAISGTLALEKPYKVYTALLTQTGTNAPVATVLENTLGAITFNADGTEFSATSTGLFITGKLAVFINGNYSGSCHVEYGDINTFYFYSKNAAGSASNDLLINTPIEIRIYN